jgi:protein O-mannosyl-transferase
MAAKNKITQKSSVKPNDPAQKVAASRPFQKNENPTNTFQSGFWKQYWLPCLIFTIVSFALYAATIGFGYVLDDQMVIWENIYVQKGFGGLREIFAYDSFMGYFKEQKFLLEGGRYRPLSLATFAMEVGIFGKDHPNIGHAINILLYVFTNILLFRVLLGLFPAKEDSKWYFSVPFIATLLFALHPLHVEVVANIKGRDEILALIGSLGALYASLKYFDKGTSVWLWMAGLSLFLGMLAKENAITFLAVIPLTVWFFTKIPATRALSASIPLFIATLLFILVRYKAMGYMLNHGKSMDDIMNNPFLQMTGSEKYATIFLTLGWYVKLLFYPHPLTHDYYPYHVPKVGWSDWRAIGSFLLYAGMGVYAVMNIKKRSVPAYAILFYLLTLSIVSNLFVGVGTFMNERFIFISSVGFCILAAWFIAEKMPQLLKEREGNPYILGIGLVAITCALYGFRVWTRVPDWKTGSTLNLSAVNISENSCRAHCFYTTAMYQDVYNKSKDPVEKAKAVDSMEYHINRSLQINPDYPSALTMKAAISACRFEQDNQLDKLFVDFEMVLRKIPYNTSIRKYIGEYTAYLKGSSPNKYTSFCHRIGYDFYYKEKKDVKSALEYLNYGLLNQTEDTRILEDLVEVYTASGNAAKAAEMQNRANISKQ